MERDGDELTFERMMRECYYTFGLFRQFMYQKNTKIYVKDKINIDL